MSDKSYKRALFIGLSAIMVFSPLARGSVRLWSTTLVLLGLYALIFLWLWMAVDRREETRSRGPSGLRVAGPGKALDLPILLAAALAVVSAVFSVYKHGSIYALAELFAYIGLYYLVSRELDCRMRRRLIWVAISIGTTLSIYGIMQYFGILGSSWWRPQGLLAATYTNHNHFAGYLELVIPVTATIFIARWAEGPHVNKFVLASALTVMLAAFMLTQSRGAWVSLGVSIAAVIFLTCRRGLKNPLRLLAAALIILSIASLAYFSREIISSRMDAVAGIAGTEDGWGGRLKIWQGALGMAAERPLAGTGIGSFDHGFYRYRVPGFNARAVYAHNDYLQAASEMGVFAPVLMTWIFIAAVWAGFRNSADPYALGCAAGALSLALHGLVDFNFHIPANMVLFIIWLAVIMGEPDVKRT